jgi:hypothetical protein
MGVLHAFQCKAHGTFEQIVGVKKKGVVVPKCPHGCSKSFVTLIFVQAPGHIRPGTRRADRLVREAAEMQGLSDLSLSPSRSGGSVMDRLRKKNRTYPEAAAARAGEFGVHMPALTNRENKLSETGYGDGYDPSEWKKNKAGQLVHTAAGHKTPHHLVPMGATGVEVERVKEKPT